MVRENDELKMAVATFRNHSDKKHREIFKELVEKMSNELLKKKRKGVSSELGEKDLLIIKYLD